MSSLTKVLEKNVKEAEEGTLFGENPGRYRLEHHLMPPVGWLNDPNGLCWFQGKYHVFFQYSPFEVKGGLKFWGHYSGADLLSWKYEGAALYPDSPYDCHGVYSGSALAADKKMQLFYTGNVKLDGDYDYINNGRETSTICVESADGVNFGVKKEVISFEEYPKEYTCHIRDPKVWKEDGKYHMVLGGRLKEDKGSVLFYESEDGVKWNLEKTLSTGDKFGYMWECPDYFTLDVEKVLSVSPQGLEREEFRFQNIYQSGYFLLREDGSVDKEDFREWDFGFDFYAPQTFADEKGRRILIGWMGMPDADEEYVNRTVEEGWQHCLTIPRVLSLRDGVICQNPVEEMKALRGDCRELDGENEMVLAVGAFELEVEPGKRNVTVNEAVRVEIGDSLVFSYADGAAEISLSEAAGAGRKVRRAKVDMLSKIRILADISAVEIYLNDGETVFSTRYYPEERAQWVKVAASEFTGRIWELHKMSFTKE